MPLSFPSSGRSAYIVGQDGILRAGWLPAPFGVLVGSSGRVANPPQVNNLPHNFRRIPVFGKTNWHWALLPAGSTLVSSLFPP